MSYLEDIQLWRRISGGDRAALSELFKKYYRKLLNYGLTFISNDAIVKDSIQEVFIAIWDQRHNLSEVDYVRSYLYISLRRMIFRQARQQKNRESRNQSYTNDSFQYSLNRENIIILNELEKEQQDQLENALRNLNKRQKEAIFLKFFNGLSASEIAEVMEVKPQSVYNHIHRAINVLRDVLE